MMLAVWLGGALVFTIAEDWSYLDASYYCFQTLATIGYGDILPSTGFGLAFAFFFAFTGLGLFAAVVNGLWSGDLLI
jgi:voltage-gated potassium channel